jgi:hypothetical protein
MNQNIKAIEEVIKLKEEIMIESQTQIRQAQDILERMRKVYKRAMEDKIYLQDSLLKEQVKLIKQLEQNQGEK